MSCKECGAPDAMVCEGEDYLCDRCADRRLARATGWPELPDPPEPMVLSGPDGRAHELRYRLRRAPTGICAELEEVGVPPHEGFRLAVLGDHDAPVDGLLQRVRDAAIRRVAAQYLQPAKHRAGWDVVDMEVVGRFIWDSDEDRGPYLVVVDGRVLTWDELGRAFESYEGWEFRIEIEDSIEDLRTDAEILPFPSPAEPTSTPPTRSSSSVWTIEELKRAIATYEHELNESGVGKAAVRTHVDRTTSFVEWLAGDAPPAAGPSTGSLPAEDLALARRWVQDRNDRLPERAVGQIVFELDVDAQSLTLYECRPPWRPEAGTKWSRFPIVRFRYTKGRREWATYWRDRNSKFHRFDPLPASRNLQDLIDAVEADRSGIFWG